VNVLDTLPERPLDIAYRILCIFAKRVLNGKNVCFYTLMECIKCRRKNIKYRCIGCKIPICNVCSVACSEKTPGYCEKKYFVVTCDECQTSSSKKRPFSEPRVLNKPQQSMLSSLFINNDKTSLGNKESAPTATNSGTLTKESPQSTSGQRTLTQNLIRKQWTCI
jgi:hypothetical protein